MAYNSNYSQRGGDRVRYDIIERIGVLGERKDGWTREVNIVAWNGAQAKVDIRDWAPDHKRMTKGVTLLEDEAENLVRALAVRYGLRVGNNTMNNMMNNMAASAVYERDSSLNGEPGFQNETDRVRADAQSNADAYVNTAGSSGSGLYDDGENEAFRSDEVAEDALDGDDEYE